MTIFRIQDGEERENINYSVLPEGDIEKRIKGYEKKYGKNYDDFYNRFDCGEASLDELTDLLDWENLVEEKKARLLLYEKV